MITFNITMLDGRSFTVESTSLWQAAADHPGYAFIQSVFKA